MNGVMAFVHEGLGNSSYLVGLDDGEAILVDPDRSVQRYLDGAQARGWQITSVLETHLHADFVTGSLETAAAVGARLVVPRGAEAAYPHYPVDHGARLPLPGALVEVVASPGHTPEHVGYVLRREGEAPALFSGGSLIVGGAARTDLISPERTAELTRAQFHSLRDAFRHLPDETLLLPTHGGGSFCSAGAGGERTSTLGRERAENPTLAAGDEEEFERWFPATFPAAPAYFFRLRAFNRAGPRLRMSIPLPPSLRAGDFDRAREMATIIDVRPQREFMRAHIPGAVSIAFRDAFATWLGWLIPGDAPLLFVLGDEPLHVVLDESLLVGYERFAGVLAGGMAAWETAGLPAASAGLVDVDGAARLLGEGALAVDVREPDEFAAGHIPGAIHIPLGQLSHRLGELPSGRPLVTYCGHGERSASALSLLERAGLGPLANLDGGAGAWREAGRRLVAA